MTITWYTIIAVLILIGGMGYTIYFYFASREIYNEFRIGYRKVYYVYMLIIGSLFWMFGVFPASNLATLGAFVIGMIVMDLFIFQTPDITKFMSNEFKHDGGLVNQLRETEDSSIRMRQQLQFVNNYMPKRDKSWELTDGFDFTPTSFHEYTEEILQQYGDTFGLHVVPFSLVAENSSDDETESESETTEETRTQATPEPNQEMDEDILNQVIDYIYEEFKLNNNMLGMTKKKLVRKLKEQESVEFFKNKQGAVIFPYRGEYIDMVIYVYPKMEDSTEKAINATGYDALLLINMLHTFDLYVKSIEESMAGE